MFDQEDVKRGKPIAVIMYIIPILFFLPLVADDYKNPLREVPCQSGFVDPVDAGCFFDFGIYLYCTVDLRYRSTDLYYLGHYIRCQRNQHTAADHRNHQPD